MIKSFFSKLKKIFQDSVLRKKIFFVLGILIVFRALSAIPIPGVDHNQLATFLSNNEFLGFINIFSGGGLSALSIVMLGVGPYITASIIMQLMSLVSPRVKELYHESGEIGRKKFSQYSRLLTVPLALLQAFGFMLLLKNQGILPAEMTTVDTITNMIVITAGSMLLVWLGELVTEFGIGNGVSLIIFAGIVSGLPTTVGQFILGYDASQLPTLIALIVLAIVIIIGVVMITEGERSVQVTHAKQVRGGSTYGGTSNYLPLRINQAGVIPIIFAMSVLLFPSMLVNFLGGIDNATLQSVLQGIQTFLSNQLYYGIAYFVLVVIFTFFYTAVTFDPEAISKNLQRSGAFIPGIRPGHATAEFISRVVTRITLIGAVFLGFIAVLPIIVQSQSGLTGLTVGGTSLLIVVSVVIDLIKKMDAQISMREY